MSLKLILDSESGPPQPPSFPESLGGWGFHIQPDMYAKIFTQIYDSSLVESPEVRFTFMDLLVLADVNGVVDITHEAIARRTNRPIEVIRRTIQELESPDLKSRTPDEGGARIRRLDDHRDWGWEIVNFEYFHQIASEDQRRAQTKSRTRKWRKMKVGDAPVTHGDAQCVPVTLPSVSVYKNKSTGSTSNKDREEGGPGGKKGKETELPLGLSKPESPKRPTLEAVRLCVAKAGLPESDADWFWNKCEGNGWTNGGSKIKSWPHVIAAWKAAGYMPSQKHSLQKQPAESKELKQHINIRSI